MNLSSVPRRPVWAEIDLTALVHNLSVVRSLIPAGVRIMAVVKADAYGHGAVACAKRLLAEGVEILGVALLQEAVTLRHSGIDAPILVMTPPLLEDAEAYVLYDVAFTLVKVDTARVFAEFAAAAGTCVRCHLKVDTGMGRVGIAPTDAREFLQRVQHPALAVEGIATHFASSDDDLPLTRKQWESFSTIVAELRAAGHAFEYAHASNSGAILHHPEGAGTCVRPGILLYGYAPTIDHPLAPRLRPVLSLKARVDFVKRIPAGTGISYGWRYRASRETTIATVPLGYADGFSRRLTGNSSALVHGIRMPVAGTICMDQIMLDAGDHPIRDGDLVTLIGSDGAERITAWDLAVSTGTIPYEILTGISARVPRVFVD